MSQDTIQQYMGQEESRQLGRDLKSLEKTRTIEELYKDEGVEVVVDKHGLKWHYLNKKLICGAKLRNKDQFCHKACLQGKNRCKFHGGMSPRGVMASRFKTGEHSIYNEVVPKRLVERVERALNDKNLISVRQEIAVVEARITDLLERVDTGESGVHWRTLSTLYDALRKASSDGDQAKFVEVLSEMGKLIKRGANDYAAWDEVIHTIETRRKLVESEHKKLVAMKQIWTAEQALTFVSNFITIIRKHVSDPKTLVGISNDVQYLLGSGNTKPEDL